MTPWLLIVLRYYENLISSLKMALHGVQNEAQFTVKLGLRVVAIPSLHFTQLWLMVPSLKGMATVLEALVSSHTLFLAFLSSEIGRAIAGKGKNALTPLLCVSEQGCCCSVLDGAASLIPSVISSLLAGGKYFHAVLSLWVFLGASKDSLEVLLQQASQLEITGLYLTTLWIQSPDSRASSFLQKYHNSSNPAAPWKRSSPVPSLLINYWPSAQQPLSCLSSSW